MFSIVDMVSLRLRCKGGDRSRRHAGEVLSAWFAGSLDHCTCMGDSARRLGSLERKQRKVFCEASEWKLD